MIEIYGYLSFELFGKCTLKKKIEEYFYYFISKDGKSDFKIFFTDIKSKIDSEFERKKEWFIFKKGNCKLAINIKKRKILCDKQFPSGWLINYIEDCLRIKLIEKGATFLHGSCVQNKDKTLVFVGWHNSGKTSLLLNFLEKDYKYMGDDRIILTSKGEILAYPTRIHIESHTFRRYKNILKPILIEKLRFKIENLLRPLSNSKNYFLSEFFSNFIHAFIMAKRRFIATDLFNIEVGAKSKNIKIIVLEKGDKIKLSKMSSSEFLQKNFAMNLLEYGLDILKIACGFDFLFEEKSFVKMMLNYYDKERKILMQKNIFKLSIPKEIDFEKVYELINKL